MNVDTLLTRQMELYISLRQPPTNPQELVQLMGMMKNYKRFFESLRSLAERFSVEPQTVFQSFMYISVGGTVSFDRQHQDGAVPMHQAKVLARSNAIELSQKLCKDLPNSELMVYVGLSRDLRNTLRVKVEDGNDLKTAEKSVCEAVEYLNFIHSAAHRNTEMFYAIYKAEEPSALASLLSEAEMSMTGSSATLQDTFSSTYGALQLPSVGEEGIISERELTPLPSPLSSFDSELRKHCASISDASTVSGSASKRLKSSQVLLDWIQTLPADYFTEHLESILGTVVPALGLLAAEKRSALCRMGCDIIIALMRRLSWEPAFIEDLHRGVEDMHPTTFSGALSTWVSSLTKGIYVTIAAISLATDAALRVIAIQSHGHMSVVYALMKALSGGAQTELRRKCLGYLALCVVAVHQQVPQRMKELVHLLGPVAVKYVSNGDSPSRKMARSLCSVLRLLDPAGERGDKNSTLHIDDERIRQLIHQERPQVECAVLGGPEKVEELLFEASNFVSSLRSIFSGSSQRSLAGSTGGRNCGMRGGAGRTAYSEYKAEAGELIKGDSQRALSSTAAGVGEKGGLAMGNREHTVAAVGCGSIDRLSAPQRSAANIMPHARVTPSSRISLPCAGDQHSDSTKGGVPHGGFALAFVPTAKHSSPLDESLPPENTQFDMIYDSEAFLGSLDDTPKSAAKHATTEESSRRPLDPLHASAAYATLREGSGHGFGSRTEYVTAAAASSNGAPHHIFPALVSAPRSAAHLNPPVHGEEEDGILPPPRGVPIPSPDRLLPISLRSHSGYDSEIAHRRTTYLNRSNGLAPSGPSSTRTSQSPNRKNKDKKIFMKP